jgi:transcriptional regulator with XRE-family HTH domain
MEKQDKNNNAVEILQRRYIDDNEARKESLQTERINADVAQKIYDMRKEAGLTQKELAKLIGTTQSVISRLEDADYEGHSLTMLSRIAHALKRRLTIQIDSPAEKDESPYLIVEEPSYCLSRSSPDYYKSKGLRPGQIAPQSGQYQQIGPRGGRGKEVTVVRGEPLPPTPNKSMSYILIDPVKRKTKTRSVTGSALNETNKNNPKKGKLIK